MNVYFFGLKGSKGDNLLKKLKEKADVATKKGAEIGKTAVEKGPEFGKQLKRHGIRSIESGIGAARKAATSGEKNIEILKKLAELKEEGIITEEEFIKKKKDILDRI